MKPTRPGCSSCWVRIGTYAYFRGEGDGCLLKVIIQHAYDKAYADAKKL